MTDRQDRTRQTGQIGPGNRTRQKGQTGLVKQDTGRTWQTGQTGLGEQDKVNRTDRTRQTGMQI